MKEQWKRIFINNLITNYEVSSFGRCRNTIKLQWKTQGMLKPKFNKQNGYLSYCLVVNGENYYRYAHRLVGEYFIEGDVSLDINHKDGVKTNNVVGNLEWVTKEQNMKHCFEMGLSTVNRPIEQFSLDGKFISRFNSASEAERKLKIKARSINNALLNKVKVSYGFQWKYEDDKSEVFDVSNDYKKMNVSIVQLDNENNIIKVHNSISDACREINRTNNGLISQVCKNNRKSAYGYKWMYKEDYDRSVDDDIVYSHF